MPLALAGFKERISPKTLLLGLLVGTAVYAVIGGYVLLKKSETLAALEKSLMSTTIEIQREPEVPQPAPIQTVVQGPLQTVDVETIPTVGRDQTPPKQDLHASEKPIEEPSSMGDKLRAAPMEGLTETTAAGVLPKIGKNGLTPFTAYKKPFSITQGQPVIAIAVMDYGLSDAASAAILEKLPPGVSVLLSPYSSKPTEWQKKARERGHEIWLDLPVAGQGYPSEGDPGPKALVPSADLQYNQERIKWTLSRTQGYAGIAASTDDAMDRAPAIMQTIFRDVFARGLGYFELRPRGNSLAETIALGAKAPFLRNQYMLGEVSLKALEREAQERGYVVGIIKPYPKALNALDLWLDTLEQKGIVLAPLSAVAEMLSESKKDVETAPIPTTTTDSETSSSAEHHDSEH